MEGRGRTGKGRLKCPSERIICLARGKPSRGAFCLQDFSRLNDGAWGADSIIHLEFQTIERTRRVSGLLNQKAATYVRKHGAGRKEKKYIKLLFLLYVWLKNLSSPLVCIYIQSSVIASSIISSYKLSPCSLSGKDPSASPSWKQVASLAIRRKDLSSGPLGCCPASL